MSKIIQITGNKTDGLHALTESGEVYTLTAGSWEKEMGLDEEWFGGDLRKKEQPKRKATIVRPDIFNDNSPQL